MVACVAVIEELFVDSRLFSGRVWPSLRSHKDCLDHLTLTSAVQISIRKLFNIVATSLNQARCTIEHLLRVSKTGAFPKRNRHKKITSFKNKVYLSFGSQPHVGFLWSEWPSVSRKELKRSMSVLKDHNGHSEDERCDFPREFSKAGIWQYIGLILDHCGRDLGVSQDQRVGGCLKSATLHINPCFWQLQSIDLEIAHKRWICQIISSWEMAIRKRYGRITWCKNQGLRFPLVSLLILLTTRLIRWCLRHCSVAISCGSSQPLSNHGILVNNGKMFLTILYQRHSHLGVHASLFSCAWTVRPGHHLKQVGIRTAGTASDLL